MLTVAPQSAAAFSFINPSTGMVEPATASALASSSAAQLITGQVNIARPCMLPLPRSNCLHRPITSTLQRQLHSGMKCRLSCHKPAGMAKAGTPVLD